MLIHKDMRIVIYMICSKLKELKKTQLKSQLRKLLKRIYAKAQKKKRSWNQEVMEMSMKSTKKNQFQLKMLKCLIRLVINQVFLSLKFMKT